MVLNAAPPAASGDRIIGADGVRAVACLSVLGHHLCQRPLIIVPETLKAWFATYGDKGVAVFFVLSGMLLSMPFWRRYLTASRFPSLKVYAVRRLARIVPAYYLCLVVLFFLAYDYSAGSIVRLVSGLTFTSPYHWRTYFPSLLSGPLWSIGVEMTFYALLPLWMAGLFRYRRTVSPAVYFAISAVGLVLFQQILLALWPSCADAVDESADSLQKLAAEWLPRMNPLGLFAHFLFGCMAGYVVAKTSRGSTAETSPAAGASRWNRFDLFSGLLVVAMLTDLQISNLSDLWPGCPDIVERIFQSRHLPVMSYDWPTFPLLVVALLISLSQSRCLGRWLDNPFFSWTAILSFGIYLWHVPVVKVLWRLLPSVENEPVVQLLFVVASSGFSYLLAHLSYRYCEKPVLDRVHRRAA